MRKNIGTIDRLLRLTLSLVLFGFAWWLNSWVLVLVGLFTLYEAIASWCILYQLLGKNTCPIRKEDDK